MPTRRCHDLSAAQLDRIQRTVLQPTIDGMAERGTPYVGVLYAGLMLTSAGPQVLEFNCRFGDPETQVILPLLETPLDQVLQACVAGQLDQVELRWNPGACATVVLAAPGYPGSYPKGCRSAGWTAPRSSRASRSCSTPAQAAQSISPVTSGGRVLAVSGLGQDLRAALERAYAGVEQVHFEGAHYRRDIGGRS